MAQVIIYEQNSQVAICTPTGEIPIDEVLAKDCPQGAIIVDDNVLPQGSDAQFFDAWELVNGAITVNFSKAQQQKLNQYNAAALQLTQIRQLNTLAGINNQVTDTDFFSQLTIGRESIANATTTQQLVLIPLLDNSKI